MATATPEAENRKKKRRDSVNGDNTRMQRKRGTSLSRSLSWVLRHSAPSLGLTISSDGYIPVRDILNCGHKRFHLKTEEDVRRVVETDDKQRYKLCRRRLAEFRPTRTGVDSNEEDGDVTNDEAVLCIRANQGHTIPHVKSEHLLTPIPPAELEELETIVHGTYWKAWTEHIQHEGLSRMARNHIHCAPGLPKGDVDKNEDDAGSGRKQRKTVLSGIRSNCQIFVFIDGKRCAEDGIEFFRSENGVILTAGVNNEGILPVEYFSKVVAAKTKEIIFEQKRGMISDRGVE